MNRFDRYLRVVQWAQKRYQQANGRTVVSTGGVLAPYGRIETVAWDKYIKMDRDAGGCLVFGGAV